MLCTKCNAAMTEHHAYDFSTEEEEFIVTAWQCGRCGHMMEEIATWLTRNGMNPRRITYAVHTQFALVGAC